MLRGIRWEEWRHWGLKQTQTAVRLPFHMPDHTTLLLYHSGADMRKCFTERLNKSCQKTTKMQEEGREEAHCCYIINTRGEGLCAMQLNKSWGESTGHPVAMSIGIQMRWWPFQKMPNSSGVKLSKRNLLNSIKLWASGSCWFLYQATTFSYLLASSYRHQ